MIKEQAEIIIDIENRNWEIQLVGQEKKPQ